ncbi:hypothetical protein ACFX19_041641 [Malus domestica]
MTPAPSPVTRTTILASRRVVRPDKDLTNQISTTVNQMSNGYLNIHQQPLSPQQPPPQRILRIISNNTQGGLCYRFMSIFTNLLEQFSEERSYKACLGLSFSG